MKCCICGMDLEGQPAMVDRRTGEAFCYRDRGYFGVDPRERPHRTTVVPAKAPSVVPLNKPVKESSKDIPDILPIYFNCPFCGEELELDKKERKEKKFICAVCGKFVDMTQK